MPTHLNTKGISVSVVPSFDGDMQDQSSVKYIFSYTITVHNTLPHAVQLISRKWHIFDSIGTRHDIEGDGVVGLQPIIKSTESFSYSSWCPLESNMGTMEGHYNMLDLETNEMFQIEIPKFDLIVDWVRN